MPETLLSLDMRNALRLALVEIAREAGTLALGAWRRGEPAHTRVQTKHGGSPVTEMDFAVDAALAKALGALQPGWHFHSEEGPEGWTGATGQPAFVVDPLDGTRNFIEGGDEWCVVIGVVADGRPIAGVVHVPVRAETFSAAAGCGAFLNAGRLPAVPLPGRPYSVIGPRMMIEEFAKTSPVPLTPGPRIHALAHRLAMIARGDHALALARPGAHDWDIVASDCILAESGCALLDQTGQPPRYALRGEAHDSLVAGGTELVEKILNSPKIVTKPLTKRL